MNTRKRKSMRWLKKSLYISAVAFAVNAASAFFSGDPAANVVLAWQIVTAGLVAGALAFSVGWATGASDPAGEGPGTRPLVPWWAALLVAVLLTAWAQQPGGSKRADDIIAGFAT